MVKVVGVRFKNAGKIYYFDPEDLELSDGDKVVVETVRGLEFGEVAGGTDMVPEDKITPPLRRVVRKATAEDEARVKANKEKEKKAFEVALDKIEMHGLPMKLVDVEYTFDNTKIIFFFTSEGRVDFRELVKDLAGVFRTRIELRQIGVRDEAKMVGGLGTCGRPLCCVTFLGDFEPVSIKMAKDQSLSLNPSKISGMCGRLMCCLRYEHEVYQELRKGLPPVGSEVDTEAGVGKIVELNPLSGIATVKLVDGTMMNVDVRKPRDDEKTHHEVCCDNAGEIHSEEAEPELLQENSANPKDEAPSKKKSSRSRRRRRNRQQRKQKQSQAGQEKQTTSSEDSGRSRKATGASVKAKAESKDDTKTGTPKSGSKTGSGAKPRRRKRRRNSTSSSKLRQKTAGNPSEPKEKPTGTGR